MPIRNSCANCQHFTAGAFSEGDKDDGLCQRPLPDANPVVHSTTPICRNYEKK